MTNKTHCAQCINRIPKKGAIAGCSDESHCLWAVMEERDELRADLALNASMLARQTDLARVAEMERDEYKKSLMDHRTCCREICPGRCDDIFAESGRILRKYRMLMDNMYRGWTPMDCGCHAFVFSVRVAAKVSPDDYERCTVTGEYGVKIETLKNLEKTNDPATTQ